MLVEILEDGEVWFGGEPVSAWVRRWLKAREAGCDHERHTDPRYAGSCRKCGRLMA